MTNINVSELATVKTMIFTKGNNILTVVSAVPKEDYGKVAFRLEGEKFRPNSQGTILFTRLLGYDPMLFRPSMLIPLAQYEKHIDSLEYQFIYSLPQTKGKSISDAFVMSRVFIRGRFNR